MQLTKRARQKLRITRWETLCQLPKPPSAGLQANYFAFATRPFRSSPSPYAHNLRRKGGGWEKLTEDSRLKTRTAHWTIRKEKPRARVAAGGLPFPAFPDCFGWGKWGSRSKIHRIRVPLLSFDPSNQRDNYTTDTANTRVTKVTNLLGIVSIVRYPCTFATRFQFVSSL